MADSVRDWPANTSRENARSPIVRNDDRNARVLSIMRNMETDERVNLSAYVLAYSITLLVRSVNGCAHDVDRAMDIIAPHVIETAKEALRVKQ